MKTQYKFTHFELIEKKAKTSVWGCHNNSNGTLLGVVRWESAWRQYCFYPEQGMVFSVGCMVDINHFIKHLRTFEVQAKIKEVKNEEATC